jgi:hypothetical protein
MRLASPLCLTLTLLPTSMSSNFQLIFDDALKAYKKCTKNALLTHPLADRLEACDSASSIQVLTVLQEQAQELNQSRRGNKSMKDVHSYSTVDILDALSETLGNGVGSSEISPLIFI